MRRDFILFNLRRMIMKMFHWQMALKRMDGGRKGKGNEFVYKKPVGEMYVQVRSQ